MGEFTEFCTNQNGPGKKISQIEARALVHDLHWDDFRRAHRNANTQIERDNILKKVVSIRYRKCIIQSILSQSDCVGIRFYIAKLTTDEVTLVMVGYDANDNDLKTTNPHGSIILEDGHDLRPIEEQTYIAEVGGGDSFGRYWPRREEDAPIIGDDTQYQKGMKEYFKEFMRNIE